MIWGYVPIIFWKHPSKLDEYSLLGLGSMWDSQTPTFIVWRKALSSCGKKEPKTYVPCNHWCTLGWSPFPVTVAKESVEVGIHEPKNVMSSWWWLASWEGGQPKIPYKVGPSRSLYINGVDILLELKEMGENKWVTRVFKPLEVELFHPTCNWWTLGPLCIYIPCIYHKIRLIYLLCSIQHSPFTSGLLGGSSQDL